MLECIRAEVPEAAVLTATIPDLSLHMPLRPRTRSRVTRGCATSTRPRARWPAATACCASSSRITQAGDRDNYAGDGFHPSPEGNRRRRPALMRALAARFAIKTQPLEAPRATWSSGTGLFSEYFDALSDGDSFRTRGRTLTEARRRLLRRPDRRLAPPALRRRVGRRSAFGERIAHGMLVLSYAVGLVPLDPERIVALRRVEDAVFKAPARLGDTIHVEGKVARRTRWTTRSGSWAASGGWSARTACSWRAWASRCCGAAGPRRRPRPATRPRLSPRCEALRVPLHRVRRQAGSESPRRGTAFARLKELVQ